MTGKDPEDVAPSFGIEGEPAIEGDTDPDEALHEIEERLQYLEAVWPSIDETDPQQQVIALEIVALRETRDALEGHDE